MAIFSPDIKKYPLASIYLPPGGCFYCPYGTSYFSCRVEFHEFRYCNREKPEIGFFYRCYDMPGRVQPIENIVKCISEGEDKIGLAKEDQLQFNPSDGNCLYCMPSEWWKDSVRFTLLTILLRDITHPDLDSLYKAPTRYIRNVLESVKSFFSGNTFYHGSTYDGWMNTFYVPENLKLLKNTPSDKDNIVVRHHIGWGKYDVKPAKR